MLTALFRLNIFLFRDVSKVAEILCGVAVDLMLAQTPLDTEGNGAGSAYSGNDMIWQSLRTLTASKARPFKFERTYFNEKIYVLSNLLDCAVQAPDKQQRRTYIGRIMTLKKSTQKAIMAMIEARSSNSTPKKEVLSEAKSTTKTQIFSPLVQASSSKSLGNSSLPSWNSIGSNTSKTPSKGLFATQSPFKATKETTEAVISRMNCTGAGNINMTAADTSTPHKANSALGTTMSPLKSSLKKSGDGSHSQNRGHSVAFGLPGQISSSFTPNKYTTNQPQSVGTPSDPGFLSPGTLESPGRMQSIVMNVQNQNKELQQKLEAYHDQEIDLKKKMDDMELVHRKSMMSLEAQSLARIQDLAQESEERIASLQEQLIEAQELSSKGLIAMQELKTAKDELEVVNHSKSALAETTEKLRRYKEKITELQDVKEALRKEQEAHGKSVNELIRLENDVQQMQPVKRQVEEYRIRAIEAEVKLVECQDYLRRMERHCKDQNAKNEHLYQDVIMQKEHMDELQRRIHDDTQRVMETTTTISGIGEGISELNPELKDELVRLRNENLQLRAFQAKRTEDAVQYLEESLDDTKRLADRYKEEFLRLKDELASMSAALSNSEQREADLHIEVQQMHARCDELEQNNQVLQGRLESTAQQLDATKRVVETIEKQNATLRADLDLWMQKKQESDTAYNEQSHVLQEIRTKLEVTDEDLKSTQDEVESLKATTEKMEVVANENENLRQHMQNQLERTIWELDDTKGKYSKKIEEMETLRNQNSKLQQQICNFEETIKIEQDQRKEEVAEAQKSLEATRNLLEIKNKKELDELHENMAKLLDDERKANRRKDEESKRKTTELEQHWQQKYLELQEHTSSSLQNSRQQAQEQVDFIKGESAKDIIELKEQWAAEVEKIKKESSDALDNFVRKGKEKVKVMQTKVQEEMQRLDDERRDIEEKYEQLEKQSSDNEGIFQEQMAMLRQQLAFSTSQVNDYMRESEEYLDRIKYLDREKFKLHEENEQYRRQLGGRYGSEGHIQSQLEKLQNEYNAIVEENRNIKRQQSQALSNLEPIMESGEDGGSRSYRRGGGVDRRALTQLQKEYEERIDSLNSEKRDLIMKMSSQSTDVHRAEKRAWEAEEAIMKLKAENTSLQLKLQRAESSPDDHTEIRPINENRSPGDSFPGTYQTTSSPARSITISPAKASPAIHSSPSIDRAKKHKMEQEHKLRNQFSSMTKTPPAIGQLTITNTGKSSKSNRRFTGSDDGANIPEIPLRPPSPDKMSRSRSRSPSKISKMASDVFRLGFNRHSGSPSNNKSDGMPLGSLQTQNIQKSSSQASMVGNEQLDNNNQECQQS